MLANVLSAAIVGVDAHLVDVEVDISSGLPQFSIVGLPDATVRESRDRVRAALKNSGFHFPVKKVTVNLAPANIKKEGAGLDLAIALGILAAEDLIPPEAVKDFVFVGELSLDGRLKPIPGALSIGAVCRRRHPVLVSAENAGEAALVEGTEVFPIHTLPQAVEFLRGALTIAKVSVSQDGSASSGLPEDEDFADVKGQAHAKRALEVAAAGGHNLLMMGPPGSGKTMLARRLPGILPLLAQEEALETSRIHSVVGQLSKEQPLMRRRPFRAPHHSISEAGLIGGGTTPRPGEVSLAHNGVLFLDEAGEFGRATLDGLRQPLEDGHVTVTRVSGSLRFPARFMVVAAMNPCPCGYYGDSLKPCTCAPSTVTKYQKRISGPPAESYQYSYRSPRVDYEKLSGNKVSKSSESIRKRVEVERNIQNKRFTNGKATDIVFNADMRIGEIRQFCRLQTEIGV